MIRKLKPDDVKNIETILKNIANFNDAEVSVAMELVNAAAADAEQTDYNVFVYEEKGNVIGYHCTGKRPLTDAVYDLYWIVTDPGHKNKGVGKTLLGLKHMAKNYTDVSRFLVVAPRVRIFDSWLEKQISAEDD